MRSANVAFKSQKEMGKNVALESLTHGIAQLLRTVLSNFGS